MAGNSHIFLTDIFEQMLSYYKSQYELRNDYFTVIKTNILDKSKYNLDKSKEMCLFIDENKLNNKLYDIKAYTKLKHKASIKKANKKDDSDPNKLQDYKQAGINQLITFQQDVFKLKLKDFITQNPISQIIIKKLTDITSKKEDELTFEDVYNYFYTLNNSYFTTNLLGFLNSIFKNNDNVKQEKIKEFNTLLKNLTFRYLHDKSIPDKNIYSNLSILFNKNYKQIKIKYNESPYNKSSYLDDAKLDFEQSDIIQYPNIRIFCTNITNDQDIQTNLFNRFTYFHEIGHTYTTSLTTYNINGQTVCINKKKISSPLSDCNPNEKMYLYNFGDELELHNKALYDEIHRIPFNLINDILQYNSFNKYLDVFADILAFSIIINDLKNLGKTQSEIFDYCISILSLLPGDDSHFNKELRAFINLYFNPELRSELEQRISIIPIVTPTLNYTGYKSFLDTANNYENYINDTSLDKPELSNTQSIIDAIKGNVQYNEFTEQEINEIFAKHLEPNYLKDIDNYNKFRDFINDILSFSRSSISKTNLNFYKQKYLKYKQKYLKLKKIIK